MLLTRRSDTIPPHKIRQGAEPNAKLKVQIVRQRVIVNDALNTGHRSEMAESLLDAPEGSLRIFEKHRELILSQLLRQRSE